MMVRCHGRQLLQIFATVQKESGRGVTRQMEYFNLLSKKPKKNLKSIECVK